MEIELNFRSAKVLFVPFDAHKANYQLQSSLLEQRHQVIQKTIKNYADNLKEHVQECNRLFRERQFTIREQNIQLFNSQLLNKFLNVI